MIGSSVLRYVFVAAVVAVQSVAAARAETSLDNSVSKLPKLLNIPEFSEKFPEEEGVFSVSWGTKEFPKGTHMVGPHIPEAGAFTFCLNKAIISGGPIIRADKGKCLSYAFPMHGSVKMGRDGFKYVPEAQPFYFVDSLPVWN